MDTLTEQLLDYWGNEFTPIAVDQPLAAFATDQTAEFLRSVGLPSKRSKVAAKIRDITLIEFYNDPSPIKQFVVGGEKYFSLGQHEDWDDFVGLKEKSGEVFYLQGMDTTAPEASFVNSNLKLHFYFWLLLFHNYLSKASTILQKERKQTARTLRKEFKRLDKLALLDENSYWSVIVEQIEDGLL